MICSFILTKSLAAADLAEQFLNMHATQLTYYGIQNLKEKMSDGQLAVFFRNNHFSTLFKHDVRVNLFISGQFFMM